MGRRIALGVLAGGAYVSLTGVAFDLVGRMRDQAAAQFSGRPIVFGVLALLCLGGVTAAVVVLGRRLPAMLWTAGILSLVLIPQWAFASWVPARVARWVSAWSFGLEGTSLLAGLLLALAVHATWFVGASGPTPAGAPRGFDALDR